jgi:hypothetical protein
MQNTPLVQTTLLDELELRQDEVLQQLDELNIRLEMLLRSLREFDRRPALPEA